MKYPYINQLVNRIFIGLVSHYLVFSSDVRQRIGCFIILSFCIIFAFSLSDEGEKIMIELEKDDIEQIIDRHLKKL